MSTTPEAAPAPEPGEAAAKEEGLPRTRVSEGRCTGLLKEWRGYMGWVQPLTKIQHEQASKHKGLIYLNQKDVVQADDKFIRIKEGKVVDFYVYADDDGLGAEECRPRSVLRLTLPHSEANKMLKQSSQWSEYLTDSEYYPTFEREHGVLLRKYAWPMPFALLELWGHPQELATAAVQLVAKDGEEQCHMRLLLPEPDIPKVESLPAAPRVSRHPVINAPVPCHSLSLQGTREQCTEAVKQFADSMNIMPPKTS